MLNLIDDADILLYRHKSFPHWGWWVAKYGGTPYNHVGLAHWIDGKLYVVQFHMFGPKISPIEDELKKYPNKIELFKPVRQVTIPITENNTITYKTHNFCHKTREKIILEAVELVKQDYSVKIILSFMASYTPFLRFWVDRAKKNGLNKDFVCSTLITYLYRKHFIDPCPYLSDYYTQPSDLARSPLFTYQFTL